MKRSRGRGRRGGGNPNRAHESTGPDVKIRGAASTIHEKYLQLARDASSAGDRVKAENYLQHAEHYFRIMAANQPRPSDDQNGADDSDDDNEDVQDAAQEEEKPARRRRRKPEANGDTDDTPPPADAEQPLTLTADAD